MSQERPLNHDKLISEFQERVDLAEVGLNRCLDAVHRIVDTRFPEVHTRDFVELTTDLLRALLQIISETNTI